MKPLVRRLLLASLLLARPAHAQDKLVVLLDWFINPNHGPLIVAQEIGAYQRAGLQVTFIQPADPTMPPRLVAAGHGDIALNDQPQLYEQVTQGLPLVRIGSVIDTSMWSLETLADDGIARIADLKGKRIGYNEVGGVVNLAEIGRMLASARLTLADVTLVNVGTALTTSLLTHRVDAVGVDRNFEHFEIIEKGATPIDFDYVSYGVPPAEQLIMEVNSATIHDPRYPRFLAAVKEGAAYIKAHPDDAWRLFLRAYPDLNNTLNKSAWDYTISHFSANPAALDRAKYQRFQDFLVQNNVIPAALPLDRITAEPH